MDGAAAAPGSIVLVSHLGSRIRSAAKQWNLAVGEKLGGGARSAVFAATDGAGRDLVLKLPGPRADTGEVAAAEAAALAGWADTGAAVALVDATADALLLIRARPGHPSPWRPKVSLDRTVDLAGELLLRLWSAPLSSYRYSALAEAYREDERIARVDAALERRRHSDPERGAPGVRRLPAAAAAAERLISSAALTTLLHGDFITRNLLSDATSPIGWVALDPQPVIGDPAAEVGAFAAYHPVELIMPLAVRVGLEPQRALRWAAIWTVHQAAQAWRGDQETLESLVSSPVVTALLNR